MADYAPPTLADLWALVGRDLTDPSNKVFNTSQLTDYINGGIAELNRVRPLEATHTVTWDDGTSFDVSVDGGKTATITAPSKAGTYKFHCTIHSNMHATLTVQ